MLYVIKKKKKMIKKFEYQIISFILFALHVKLYVNKIFYKEWTWDFFHLYFCALIIYCISLILYSIRVYYSLKKLNLKNFPVKSISSCTKFSNKKNIHPYAAFERPDLYNMKLLNLLYGVIFMATWRLALIFIASITNLSICVLTSLLIRNSDETDDSVILRLYLKFLKIVCRISLWLFGINKIESHYLCDQEWPKNIVSNHISALDPFYFISEHSCSFVAKKYLGKDRFVGASVLALKCVLVYREKLEDRKKALEIIKERQLLINEKKSNYPSFVIFSEGTTSNGIQLIEQKKGAFFSLVPLTPVLLVYDYSLFNPSYDILPFTWWVFLSSANYKGITLRTYWLPKVYPPTEPKYSDLSEEEKINIYHDKVSKIMFQNMKKYNPKAPQDIDNYNDWPGSFRLKIEYFQAAFGKYATKKLNKEKVVSEK